MKERIHRLVMGLACAFLLGPAAVLPAWSQVPALTYPTPLGPGALIEGVLVNIDPVNRMIQVRIPNGYIIPISVTEGVQLFHNGRPIKLENLSLGDTVTVRR